VRVEWLYCPVCGDKTRNRIREDTVLKNYKPEKYCFSRGTIVDCKDVQSRQVDNYSGYVVFTAPVSICHAALAAFINKPVLFRHWNTGFASACQNLSSVIVVK